MEFMLDSGAYSAWTKGVTINIDEYCEFIKKHSDVISHYIVLDVIGDAEKSLEAQKYMESKGLHPLPVFHQGEDWKYLEYYANNYDYICISPLSYSADGESMSRWLDKCFADFICDKEGYPKCKVHGLGLTIVNMMLRYPWYSVDSATWVLASSFGEINVPRKNKGEWDWMQAPLRVTVSNKSPKRKKNDSHYNTFNEEKREVVDEWLEFINLAFGESEFNENEEVIRIDGVSNNYKYRETANLIYFIELNKRISDYPRKFENKNMRGLFI